MDPFGQIKDMDECLCGCGSVVYPDTALHLVPDITVDSSTPSGVCENIRACVVAGLRVQSVISIKYVEVHRV